jgi:hypothetical protein
VCSDIVVMGILVSVSWVFRSPDIIVFGHLGREYFVTFLEHLSISTLTVFLHWDLVFESHLRYGCMSAFFLGSVLCG